MELLENRWALILGASSGFGADAAKELSQNGMNILGVHLDRRSGMAQVDDLRKSIEAAGRKAIFFNINASDSEKRKETIKKIKAILGENTIHLLMHSLAFGTLKPFYDTKGGGNITKAQMDMTLDVMAHSLVYWAQDLLEEKLLGRGSRIFAMTSSGGTRVFPHYGAVSAAKASLESHVRQLTLELSPLGISVNAIRAGVTDTPALRKIPNSEKIMKIAEEKNPSKRLTTTNDISKALVALSLPGTDWMTGNIIGIDGGENIID